MVKCGGCERTVSVARRLKDGAFRCVPCQERTKPTVVAYKLVNWQSGREIAFKGSWEPWGEANDDRV